MDGEVVDRVVVEPSGHSPAPPAPGKRAGARRAAKPKRSMDPRMLGLALGVTVAVVAWGYLVYAAIDFGAEARSGESAAWFFLALASLGAVACLFVGLMLVVRLLRALGITQAPAPRSPDATDSPEPATAQPAGRRAAR
ncbi:hypothetical protein [Nocardioides dokdonensis]|nr:hypothetical protein [Nocardioides dokdonensis]